MKKPKTTAIKAALAARVYLAKEEIYIDDRQSNQVAIAIDEVYWHVREAARYAMQRMETIRETNPEIALDAEIDALRAILDRENA